MILCQEWKKLVARNVETNMELEQLRISARQYSAASSSNETLRMQLQSTQNEMARERFQSSEKRMQLEEQIDKLKTDIHNEKSKCKRFAEDILRKNAIIVEIEDRLKKAECDKLCYSKQVHELNNCLASTDLELPKPKENLEYSNEMIILRTEIERLKKAREVLSKDSEIRKEIEVQVLHTQKKSQDLLTQPREKKEGLEEKCNATEQLEQLNHKPKGRKITFVTREIYALINNHQFFVENINSTRLINLLHEENCITDGDRGHLCNQPSNFYRNDALLYWMRTIPFKEYEGYKVLECFRKTEQNFFSKLLQKGGVLIKSKILSKLVKEGLFAKSSIKNVEELKEKEAMATGKLNKATIWFFSSAKLATSDLSNRDIIIVPYCRQEAGGIVIWFWCQSRDGQKELRRIYKSGILLEKLTTFFKQVSSDGVSSGSTFLVPTSIVIFEDDFTQDKITSLHVPQNYHYSGNPARRRVNHADIIGLAVLGQEVFISRHRCPDIEVYDSSAFHFKRRMEVEGMTDPEHIVSCSVSNCLYAFDWNYQGQLHAILRIDQTKGKLIKTWNVKGGGGRISIASDTNVILCIGSEDKLHEYTADGELIRIINLCHGDNITQAWHAVKLNNGLFVVCYSDCQYDIGKVYLLSTEATTPAPERIDEVEILASFGDMMDDPRSILYLSVDTKGSILVFDDANKQAVLLSSNLDKPQILVSAEHGMELPWRTCFDESTGQWFLADHHRVMVCRVTDKQVTRKCYVIISQ